MAERNRLLSSPEDDFAYGQGIPADATWRNLIPFAEFGLGMAPGSGEAMSARDAWDASGRAGNALLSGDYGQAASDYLNMGTGLLGAIPGVGIVARGTKRGAAWMDRNLPEGFNRLLDAVYPSDPRSTTNIFAGPTAKTADHTALAKAQELAASGASRDDIWRDTGWMQGVDGKWKFEIDDSGAVGRDYQLTPQQAYKAARENAIIDGGDLARQTAKSMEPYAGMTKNQLKSEYKRTGGEIVEAIDAGDFDRAKALEESRSGLSAMLSYMGSATYGPASSFLRHSELGAAYPDVYKMHTRIAPKDLDDARGQYKYGNQSQAEQIVLEEKPSWSRPKSTVLHELQHAIQTREGFGSGGTMNFDARMRGHDTRFPEIKALQGDLNEVRELRAYAESKGATPEKLASLDRAIQDRMDRLDKAAERIGYQNLAGEVEARNVQKRIPMTATERRATPPWETQDVPDEQQIVRFR